MYFLFNRTTLQDFVTYLTSAVYGPFLFLEQTVTGIAFLDTLTEWLLPN